MKTRVLASALASLVALAAQAADPVPHRFSAGTPAKAAEVNANFDAIVAQLQALVPVGTVLAYAGTTAPPGFLLCNGDEVSAADYPALYAVIGITHGRGVELNKFKLPDYQGRFLRGVDHGTGRDPGAAARQAMGDFGVTGDAPGTIQGYATAQPTTRFTTDNPGDHSHLSPTTSGGSGGYEVGVGASAGYDYGAQSAPTLGAGGHAHAVTGGGDAETRPVNAAVNWIIKY